MPQHPYTQLLSVNDMSEESRAIEEVARTTGKAIDAGRELGGFLSKYVGGSIEQAMGIVEDKLRYLRWERQIRLMESVNNLLAQKGLPQPSRKVPLQVAIPLIQGGSLEENDVLQDRWAALLANAADASSNVDVRRAYISILEDLTPLDALLLKKLYLSTQVPDFPSPQIEPEICTSFLPDYITEERPNWDNSRPLIHIEVSLGNLARLGLVAPAMAWSGLGLVHRTALGREFIKAITY